MEAKSYRTEKGEVIVSDEGINITYANVTVTSTVTSLPWENVPPMYKKMADDAHIPHSKRFYIFGKPQSLFVDADIALDYDGRVQAKNDVTDPRKVIEGYAELTAALDDWEYYHEACERMMDDEGNDGVNPPKKPASDIDALKAKYPRAVAYLKAESCKNASNVDKYSAGKKAMASILAGDDYQKAIEKMDADWSAAANQAVWNN